MQLSDINKKYFPLNIFSSITRLQNCVDIKLLGILKYIVLYIRGYSVVDYNVISHNC